MVEEIGKLDNVRRERFCQEWVIDGNGTRAAKDAGYAEDSAHVTASRLLNDDKVKARIDELIAQKARRNSLTEDYVINVLMETIDRCRQVEPVLDRKGEQVWIEGPNGQIQPAFTFNSKGVISGCELLGKHLGLWIEKDKDGKPIPVSINFNIKGVTAKPRA